MTQVSFSPLPRPHTQTRKRCPVRWLATLRRSVSERFGEASLTSESDTINWLVDQGRGEQDIRPSRTFPWRWLWLLLLASCVIVCHGCHGGDHDDELVVFLPDR